MQEAPMAWSTVEEESLPASPEEQESLREKIRHAHFDMVHGASMMGLTMTSLLAVANEHGIILKLEEAREFLQNPTIFTGVQVGIKMAAPIFYLLSSIKVGAAIGAKIRLHKKLRNAEA